MASQRIGGTLLFRIDGVQYAARGKFEYSPLASEKDGVAGQDEVHGFTEKPAIPSIKGDLSDLGQVSVTQLQNITSSALTLELANGKTIILSGAWLKGAVSVNTEEGSYGVEFQGRTATELQPQGT
jgi:hypothetical protein